MESTMQITHQQYQSGAFKAALIFLTTVGLYTLAPMTAQAANVGWAVSVGGGYGGGYGGGAWRPAAYGPGWGGGWGPSWRSGYYGPAYGYPYRTGYYSPPVIYSAPPLVSYVPSQPMVLAAQPQPPIWYYCEASGQYFPYVQSCASGWQTKPAIPPSSNAGSMR